MSECIVFLQVEQNSLRQSIGVVPQDTVLFNKDIRLVAQHMLWEKNQAVAGIFSFCPAITETEPPSLIRDNKYGITLVCSRNLDAAVQTLLKTIPR